jgi:hypothetical protein
MMQVFPTEIWLIVLLLIGVIGLIGMVMAMPIIPFIVAKLTNKKVLLVADKNMELKVRKADIRYGTHYFKKEPMGFIKEYKGRYILGGVKTDIVHVDEKLISAPEFQDALYDLQERYGISTYEDLKTALDEGRIQEEFLEVPLYFKMPLDEIANYCSGVPPDGIQGEIDELTASQNGAMVSEVMRMLPLIVVICICIIVGAVAIKILT